MVSQHITATLTLVPYKTPLIQCFETKLKKKCWDKCCDNVTHFIVPQWMCTQCRGFIGEGFVLLLLLQSPLPLQSPSTVLPFTIHLVLSSTFLHFFFYSNSPTQRLSLVPEHSHHPTSDSELVKHLKGIIKVLFYSIQF